MRGERSAEQEWVFKVTTCWQTGRKRKKAGLANGVAAQDLGIEKKDVDFLKSTTVSPRFACRVVVYRAHPYRYL
jgi:hypothetical protein